MSSSKFKVSLLFFFHFCGLNPLKTLVLLWVETAADFTMFGFTGSRYA